MRVDFVSSFAGKLPHDTTHHDNWDCDSHIQVVIQNLVSTLTPVGPT